MQGKVWFRLYAAIIIYTIITLVLFLWHSNILLTTSSSIAGFLAAGILFDEGVLRVIAYFLIMLIVLAIIFLFFKKVFLPVLIVYFLDFIFALPMFSIPDKIFSLVFYASEITIVIIAFIKTRGQKTDKLLKVKTQKPEAGVLPEDMNGNTEDGAQSPGAEIWDS